MSPPPCLCSLSVRMAVKSGICGVMDAEVSFDYCIVTTSDCVVRMRCLRFSTVLLMPFALSRRIFISVFCFGGLFFVSCATVCGCGWAGCLVVWM